MFNLYPGIPFYLKWNAGIVTFFRGEISEGIGNLLIVSVFK